MHFADALTAATKKKSPLCVGLDPQLEKLPSELSRDPAGVLAFNKGIIDAVKEIAACVKPQLAYYELLGWEGMKVFWETCSYAQERGLIVIADGKRNDIGFTCEAYADAYLYEGSPVDALTVTAYLGSDGVVPFLSRCAKNDKGIFVLVKTSNKSSGELQDLPVGDEVVHEHLAQLVESWGAQYLGKETSLSCVGAVVGATYPEEMNYLRTLMPHIPFLIPGYGAQGGTAQDVKRGFIPGGGGAIVNASRSILYASNGADWKETAAKAAKTMAEEIATAIGS
ncbi:orotidine-5'-phosphate decarboxylase [Candidatus Peregrinibacteria bacterium]|nr:orotidine-5'-phosphate decarboxylase [Candidatus Peregrinibacteria bacterium]MBI3815967.1 orotidine-5'-phosphate decarboxylase [Candidatus Peregrinibacteria bacterium]